MQTKDFPTVDVLSTCTGRLIGNISGVYEVLNWMTGESVFTHQLPRISREAAPIVLAMHPELQLAYAEADQVNTENWKFWRDVWLKRYGPTLSVPKFTKDQHEHIDPMSELVEKVHPDRIVVVKP